MTYQNLILTEKAIKKHCKRLKKEIKNYNEDSSLGEIQTLFAKTIGFNNFHELKNILNPQIAKINTLSDFYDFIKQIEKKSEHFWLDADCNIIYHPHGINSPSIFAYPFGDYWDDEDSSLIYDRNKFTKIDLNNILSLILSKNDLYCLAELKNEDIYTTYIQSKINDGCGRILRIHCSKQNNVIYCLNFIISYYLERKRNTKTYEEIKHLL